MTPTEWMQEQTEQAQDDAFDLLDYETYIVAFSGGKDSVACVLHLLERGVDPTRIELWHHDIDGREGSHLMDWPVTPSYCQAFADALNLKIYFSWKVGGFEREMLRENSKTAPTKFETPDGDVVQVGGTRGKDSTRRKFPQVSANLSVRWCSAYLKIDVGATALRNQARFNNSRTLFISGERAEESASRAKYATFEPDRADNRDGRTGRHVDRWRPVHGWDENKVWAIIARWSINPHPAYKLGWGRVSCMNCIFASSSQCASSAAISPNRINKIARYERDFGLTIHRTLGILERADAGTPYQMQPAHIDEAMTHNYNEAIVTAKWDLPAGAFGESCGPT